MNKVHLVSLKTLRRALLPVAIFVVLSGMPEALRSPGSRASGPAGSELIHVPLRWCAMRGSPAVDDPGGVGELDTDNVLWRRHERASDLIWIPGANIQFRSGITAAILDTSSFPIIDDPDPPVSGGKGMLGDLLDFNIDSKGYFDAVADCATMWDEIAKRNSTPLVGPIAINIRRFVDNNGIPTGLGGWGGYTAITSSADVCTSPTSALTASGGSMIVIDNSLSGDVMVDQLVAHELGHVLFLGHGNGLDDDGDSLVDSFCDNNETLNDPATLMNPNADPTRTLVTSLQRDMSNAVARVYSGAQIDPPAVLINGPTISDQRVDTVKEVSARSVDIFTVSMIKNEVTRTTAFLHTVFGLIPMTTSAQYFVFADLDGNQATGGSPSSLGFLTSFQGAELVTRVSILPFGGSRNVIPTVWRFQSGSFVDVTNSQINADVLSPPGGENLKPLFATVYMEVPDNLIGPSGTRVRMQAIAQTVGSTIGGELDRLPDGPTDGSSTLFMVPPEFPVCEVTPAQVRQGATAIVEASGLLPNRVAKVLLGDQMVATGPIDGSGRARISFAIPPNARTGIRVLTVGVMGTALTADCTVGVLGSEGTLSAPTLSEWGTIIMALLLLTAGTIFILRRSPLIASPVGPSGGAQFVKGINRPLFVPAVFGRVLAGILAVVFIGFAVVTWLSGPIKLLDIGGTLLSGLVCAYVVHLLILAAKDSQTNRR